VTISQAAEQFADALSNHPGRTLVQTLSALPLCTRSLAVFIQAAAVLHLLQAKNLVHARSLLILAREGTR
jgi:hypothetical protein